MGDTEESKSLLTEDRQESPVDMEYQAIPRDAGSFGNSHLRWTILFTILTAGFAILPVILRFVVPGRAMLISFAVIMAFQLLFFLIAVLAVRNFNKLMKLPVPKTKAALEVAKRRKFKHIVVVPCYLDTIPVLESVLKSLAESNYAHKLLVVMAFERKAPELESKVDFVMKNFAKPFGDLLLTFHVVQFESEIAGGCSNKNYALHRAVEHIKQDQEKFTYTITTCDTDTIFHPFYFEGLEAVYNDQNPSEDTINFCVWQPPLFYNWNLDERPFFVRSTGIVRSMMMLGGLISFNLNPMSVFSYPLELGAKVGFINPRYSVDDIIAKVRWMCTTNSQVPVKLLPIPCISGPTNGDSFLNEFSEWSKQNGRWMIGAAESFHYFLIHWTGAPLFSGLKWFLSFFVYYSIFLCSSSIFALLATLPAVLPDQQVELTLGDRTFMASLRLVTVCLMFGLQYASMLIAFVIDRLAVRLLQVKEQINPLRNFLHFVLAPFTLLVYSLLTFFDLLQFVYKGKKAAGHNMATKVGLKGVGQDVVKSSS